MKKRTIQKILFLPSLLAMLFLLTQCQGGDGITYPQGPISGGNGLLFAPFTVQIEPFSSFNLNVDFSGDRYTFDWNDHPQNDCDSYGLILTPAPFFPDPGNTQVTQLLTVTDEDPGPSSFSHQGSESLTTFVENQTGLIAALVLCVEDEEPFARSNFVFLITFP